MTADRSPLRAGDLGVTGPLAGPPGAARRPPGSRGATIGGARLVLATSDPVFSALCQQALEGSTLQLLAAVSPAELVDTARRLAPELVVLDADGQDVAPLAALASKVMLVSDARIVVVSAYLAPGSPGLCALLAAVAAGFVQKARGASWLGLPQDDRAAFVAALRVALAADDLDTGWDAGGPPAAPTGSRP